MWLQNTIFRLTASSDCQFQPDRCGLQIDRIMRVWVEVSQGIPVWCIGVGEGIVILCCSRAVAHYGIPRTNWNVHILFLHWYVNECVDCGIPGIQFQYVRCHARYIGTRLIIVRCPVNHNEGYESGNICWRYDTTAERTPGLIPCSMGYVMIGSGEEAL